MRALALLLALAALGAQAQSYPERPVHVIVPFVAGGNTDNQARIVSERLHESLGQPFVVENKVGAGGAIAAEYVAKAPRDGYTLFFAACSKMRTLKPRFIRQAATARPPSPAPAMRT